MDGKWKKFENGVFDASTKLFPYDKVLPNQEIPGVISGQSRQIDVLVEKGEGIIDIECKDHKQKIDTPKVEAFVTKMKDVKAKTGVIVSNSGFTKGALATAKYYGVKTMALVDKGHTNVSNFSICIPTVASILHVSAVRYGVSHMTAFRGFVFPANVWEMRLADGTGRNVYEFLRDLWNDQVDEVTEPGKYQIVKRLKVINMSDGKPDIATFTYDLIIEREDRFGTMAVKKAQGLYDIAKNTFIPSDDIVSEPINFRDVESWEKIEHDDSRHETVPVKFLGVASLPDEPHYV